MIWGYGSDKFLVNGLGSIFIILLMLEQMHTLLAVPSQKDRENRYIAMGGAVIGITVFMQFFWINEYSVWWNIPAQWVMLSIYGIIGEKAKGYVAVSKATVVITFFSIAVILTNGIVSTILIKIYMVNLSVIYFFVALLSMWGIKKISGLSNTAEKVLLVVVVIISVGIVYLLLFTTASRMYSVVGIVLIDSILIYLFLRTKEEQQREQYYMQQERKRQQQELYMRGIHEIDEQIKKTRHDLKKHLQSLNGYLYSEIPDIEGMRRYLAEYTQRTLILGDMVYTDSIVVNTILNAKLMFCREKGIQTEVYVCRKLKQISEVDMCSILGNALDNAIEAQLKLPVNDRIIGISIQSDEDVLDIVIKNAIAESVLQHQGLEYTSKKSSRHGYGIKIIKETVQQLDGTLDFYEKDSFFYCEIIL